MTEEKIKELIKKVKKLAEHGVGGEKVNAQSLLKKLLTKYNLSLDDFIDDTKKQYKFTCSRLCEKQLLINISSKVLNSHDVYAHYKGKSVYMTLTNIDFVRIDYLYQIYRKSLKKQIHTVFCAFLQANNIFAEAKQPNATSSVDDKELDQIFSFADNMEKTVVDALITD